MGGTAIRITPFLTVITLTALILKETEVAMAAVGAILSMLPKSPPDECIDAADFTDRLMGHAMIATAIIGYLYKMYLS